MFTGIISALGRVTETRALGSDASHGLALAIDPQDLDELLGNLLDNAWRWASARITVSAAPAADPRFVRLVIADDGVGIPPAARAHALAAGQGGDALRAALQRRLGHESALVQEHVQWALAQRPQVASV